MGRHDPPKAKPGRRYLGEMLSLGVFAEELHDLSAVDAKAAEDPSKFVGKRDLGGVEGIACVLQCFGGARVDDSERRVEKGEEARNGIYGPQVR